MANPINNPEISYNYFWGNDQFDIRLSLINHTLYKISVSRVGGDAFDPQALKILHLFTQAFSDHSPTQMEISRFFKELNLQDAKEIHSRISAAQISTMPSIARASDPTESPPSIPSIHRLPSLEDVSSKESTEQFEDMKKNLNALKAISISSTDRQRAEMTIKDFEVMSKNFSQIKACTNDLERKHLINKLCSEHGGGGLENELSSSNIKHRIYMLLNTYKLAIEKGEDAVLKFFLSFGAGGACASNRIENLAIFAAELQGHNIRNMAEVDEETTFVIPLIILQEHMIPLIEENQFAQVNSLAANQKNREFFKQYLLKNIDTIAAEFEGKKGFSQMTSFLEYLRLESLYDGSIPVNWKNLLTAFINSPNFVRAYNHIWANTQSTIS